MLNILGWVIWGVVVALALAWTFGLRVYTKKGKSVPVVMAVQGLFLWVIAISFLFVGSSKLHILWVAPVCFVVSFFLTLARGVPVFTPTVMWFTGLFVEIALVGLKRPNEP
jgi:hypothetical protein